MYAIVEINGQQFKVEEGKRLFINHIQEIEEGKTVEFEKVLLVDKVIVFKKKRRKGYRKKNGHRQQFTEVKVKQVIA